MAYISELNIVNFKSHLNFKENFKSNKNIIVIGPNGSGKTNLIESLNFFSNSKSIRGEKLTNLIKLGSAGRAKVSIEISSNKNKFLLEYNLTKNNEDVTKKFLIDDKVVKNLKSINKIIKFVWLSPPMEKIMYEGKSIKRKFIDKLIAQFDENFNLSLSEYKKYTAERLILLKEKRDEKWLKILEKKISESIYEIFINRRLFSKKISLLSKKKLLNFRSFEIIFSNLYENYLSNKDEAIKIIENTLYKNRFIDETSKRSNFSINDDEIVIKDEKKKISSDYLSTGEQKAILLSIILSNCHLYKDNNQEFIMLFDEISSHIDKSNLKKFFEEIDKFETQTWYTGNDKNLFQVIENKAFFIEIT
tara:strand:- start:32117 stop:33202 length:1086 start_codon:yes stop_codon:yes gene_type:complete